MNQDTNPTSSERLPELAKRSDRLQPPAIEQAEKGSLRSMWELLMQLRALLPYLSSLVPLLERGLPKVAPDLSEVRKGLAEVQAGSRDLGVQARSQTLALEKIETELSRVSGAIEQNRRVSGELADSVNRLTGWVRAATVLAGLGVLLLIGLTALEIHHFAR